FLLALAACSPRPDGELQPQPAVPPHRAPVQPLVVGDVCTAIGHALCFRQLACGADVAIDACAERFIVSCCEIDNQCGYRTSTKAAEIDACVAALATDPCGALLDGGTLPPACDLVRR